MNTMITRPFYELFDDNNPATIATFFSMRKLDDTLVFNLKVEFNFTTIILSIQIEFWYALHTFSVV